MENYIVSARKYRPKSFSTVVGQQALAHTLQTAIKSNRLAHAYLFCGPRGVGKTSCARIFAKTINCEHLTEDGEACEECESCRAFNEQRSYNVIELDAASNNSVDEMRNLVDQVKIPPQIGKYKVYIIDEVHMLSTSAFNAFLKTLEEPPAHAIFILATTEKHKILPTILSRCQIYDFSRITVQDIVEQLHKITEKEGITAEPAALNIIAQKADGAMRDALSIFDQVAASSMGNITYRSAIENLNVLDYEYYFRLVDSFVNGDIQQALLTYQDIRNHGFDSLFFVNGLASHFRNLLVAASPVTMPLLEVASEVAPRYAEQAKKTPLNFLYKAMDLCNECDLNYRTASNKQFLVELTLIKICQILNSAPDPTPGSGLKSFNPAPQQQSQGQTPIQQYSAPVPPAPQNKATREEIAAMHADYASSPEMALLGGGSKEASQIAQNIINRGNSMPRSTRVASAPTAKVISISGLTKSMNQQSEHKAEPIKNRRNENFTFDSLMKAWKDYVDSHRNEVFLINALITTTPSVSQEKVINIPVDNIAQQESIAAHQSSLLEFFRNALNNDFITITTSLKLRAQQVKILSPEEIAVDMMRSNENVKDLVKSLKLGIA